AFCTCAAVSLTRSAERAAQTTRAPSRAKRRLNARPIPLDAPVMIATLPSSKPISVPPGAVCVPPAMIADSRWQTGALGASSRRSTGASRIAWIPRSGGRLLVGNLAEETRDVAQPAVAGERADVDPSDDDRPVGCRQLPGEPQLAVVRVDAAHAPEA